MEVFPINSNEDFRNFRDSLLRDQKQVLGWSRNERRWKMDYYLDHYWRFIRGTPSGDGIEIKMNDDGNQLSIYVHGELTFEFEMATVYFRDDIMLVYHSGNPSRGEDGLLTVFDLVEEHTIKSYPIHEEPNSIYWPTFFENEPAVLQFDMTSLKLNAVIINPHVLLAKYLDHADNPIVTLKLFNNIGSPLQNFVPELYPEYLAQQDDPYLQEIGKNLDCPIQEGDWVIHFSSGRKTYSRLELLRYRSTFLNEAMQDSFESGNYNIYIPVMTRHEFESLLGKNEFTPEEIRHLTFLDSDSLRDYLLREKSKLIQHFNRLAPSYRP